MCESGDCGLFCILFTTLSSKSVTDDTVTKYSVTQLTWWNILLIVVKSWTCQQSQPIFPYLNWVKNSNWWRKKNTNLGSWQADVLWSGVYGSHMEILFFPKVKTANTTVKCKMDECVFCSKRSWCDVLEKFNNINYVYVLTQEQRCFFISFSSTWSWLISTWQLLALVPIFIG